MLLKHGSPILPLTPGSGPRAGFAENLSAQGRGHYTKRLVFNTLKDCDATHTGGVKRQSTKERKGVSAEVLMATPSRDVMCDV